MSNVIIDPRVQHLFEGYGPETSEPPQPSNSVSSTTGRGLSVKIKFDGADITQDISPYLLSLTYTDNEEDESDDLQLKLQDREGIWLTKYLSAMLDASSDSAKSDGSSDVDVSSYPTLRYGSKGEYVKTMQSLLVQKGQSLPRFGVDGWFASETQAAVKGFQSSVGIAVDGICGPITWSKLLGEEKQQQKQGMSIEASLKLGADFDCGKFELDSVEASGPPSIVTIKATSLPYSSQIRQTKKTKAWEKLTLSGIANEMASKNGMECMYESEYDPPYTHVEQYEESDIAFLSRLAHEAGISLKATNNIIVLFDQATYEKIASIATITKGSGYEKYKLGTGSCETKYASCRVSYTDPSTGKKIEGIAKVEDYNEKSKTNQQLEIRAKVDSVAEAKTLAEKYLRSRNKFSKTAQFTMQGDFKLVAGVCLDLKKFGPWDGKYIVTQAKHTYSSSGYSTQITLRNVLEGY